MTGSLIWLAFVGLITILYVKKLLILDKVFGVGTTDPLMGFGAITSHPAHSPTERASLQTADIARRLMRGGELHQEAGSS